MLDRLVEHDLGDPFGAGVNVGPAARQTQHRICWPGGLLRSTCARPTANCIRPVVRPTRTRARVTTPTPSGTMWFSVLLIVLYQVQVVW